MKTLCPVSLLEVESSSSNKKFRKMGYKNVLSCSILLYLFIFFQTFRFGQILGTT